MIIHSTKVQDSTAAAAAIWVANIAMPARPPAVSAEPALKPNQPTHNRAAPITASDRLAGAMLSVPYPSRLPSTIAHTSPAMPALM